MRRVRLSQSVVNWRRTQPSPGLSGVWPFEEKFVSVYGEMIEVPTALQDFSHIAGLVGVAITHSAKHFNLVV